MAAAKTSMRVPANCMENIKSKNFFIRKEFVD
jgi:hypothetical protein